MFAHGATRAATGTGVVLAGSCADRTRQQLEAFDMIASFGGDHVPCSPYAAFGTQELADGVVAVMAGVTACLMANHGMVCVADSLPGAYPKALKLEMLAR